MRKIHETMLVSDDAIQFIGFAVKNTNKININDEPLVINEQENILFFFNQ